MKYIVAVSGGIDSVVLLDLLSRQPVECIVAHVDHGIRDDSHKDEKFVRELAGKYRMEYVSTKLKLGKAVSEEVAREARYGWLEEMRQTYVAEGILTAHHEDDVLETICINLLRGTGWRGLCSLRSTSDRVRPLLGWSKAAVIDYAIAKKLSWQEDSTNEGFVYLRNRIRSVVVPRLSIEQRATLLRLYNEQVKLLRVIEDETERLKDLFIRGGELCRYETTMVDDAVAFEMIRLWLGEPLEQKRMRELLLFVKTARPGSRWSLDKERFVQAKASGLIVERPRD